MAKAREQSEEWLKRYWQLWHRYAQLTYEGRMPEEYQKWRERAPMLAKMSFEELNGLGLIMIGTPEHVTERILAHARRLDLAALACVFKFGAMPQELFIGSMRLFAKEVMPAVKAGVEEMKRARAA